MTTLNGIICGQRAPWVTHHREKQHVTGFSREKQPVTGFSGEKQPVTGFSSHGVSIATQVSFGPLRTNPIQACAGRNCCIGSPKKLPEQRNDATHAAELADGIPQTAQAKGVASLKLPEKNPQNCPNGVRAQKTH